MSETRTVFTELLSVAMAVRGVHPAVQDAILADPRIVTAEGLKFVLESYPCLEDQAETIVAEACGETESIGEGSRSITRLGLMEAHFAELEADLTRRRVGWYGGGKPATITD